jgi:hypothetical protein
VGQATPDLAAEDIDEATVGLDTFCPDALDMGSQLASGVIYLGGTGLATTPEQGATLLPL